jgi:hypothetical protein
VLDNNVYNSSKHHAINRHGTEAVGEQHLFLKSLLYFVVGIYTIFYSQSLYACSRLNLSLNIFNIKPYVSVVLIKLYLIVSNLTFRLLNV